MIVSGGQSNTQTAGRLASDWGVNSLSENGR